MIKSRVHCKDKEVCTATVDKKPRIRPAMEAYEGKILKFYRGYELTEILVLAYDYVENANKVKVAGSSELRFENIEKLLRKTPYASILPADPAHPLVLEYSLDDQGNVRAAAVKAVSKIEKDCRFLNGDTDEWASVIHTSDRFVRNARQCLRAPCEHWANARVRHKPMGCACRL